MRTIDLQIGKQVRDDLHFLPAIGLLLALFLDLQTDENAHDDDDEVDRDGRRVLRTDMLGDPAQDHEDCFMIRTAN